jgi:acetylornithine deacetylase/succinyl-diaminopimelate desuccinylase-like protein
MSQWPSTVTELTQALVRIPSVNPDGEPGTDLIGEAACAEYVAGFLRQCDAEAVIEEVLPGRPNVIGRFPTSPSLAPKPKIVFAPHLDTVGVGGMVIPPFSGEVKDGRVWGRGSSDTKGPMASMLWALKSLGSKLADLPVEVHFAGFMSEESSQHGSRHFAQHHPDYAFAIIGEPTSLRTVYKHKGCLWADVITSGVAAHGASPHLGENAIVKMTKLIHALDTEFPEVLRVAGGTDDLLGASTVNIAMINGGTRSNIVPNGCTLRVDIRVTPQLHTSGGALQVLQAFIAERDPTARVEVASSAMPLDTPADHPFVQSLVRAGAALDGAPWFCDAAYLSAGGIPSIAIGPGSIEQAHTKDEWIKISDLEDGVAFFTKWLESLT